jgi:hypothetical protein
VVECQSRGGCSNRTNGGFFTIEEGFVAFSGIAYWVERKGRDQSILGNGMEAFEMNILKDNGSRPMQSEEDDTASSHYEKR